MSKRDMFKVLGCEGEPPLRKVTLEGWLQEEDACEYVPGSQVTLEFIGRQMPNAEQTPQAAPVRNVNTSAVLKPTLADAEESVEAYEKSSNPGVSDFDVDPTPNVD